MTLKRDPQWCAHALKLLSFGEKVLAISDFNKTDITAWFSRLGPDLGHIVASATVLRTYPADHLLLA